MVRCPVCNQENPEHAKFCLNCAAPLGAAAIPEAEERKVVSVLFADLAGFTARSEQSDPEDVRAILRPYHAALRKEIERYGGTVEKFIGDAVVGVFGAPVAHEDDAERAVRAALRIQDAIGEMNAAEPGLDLTVRSAVNTGEAVVTLAARTELGEAMVAGDVINTASRLQGVCPEGGVVVGEMTHRTTSGLFDYRQLDSVRVKGKREPVAVWQAVAPLSRFGVDVRQHADTPLVGRDDELDLLRRSLTRTLRESSVQLVTVIGEPGVGKTRLVSEVFAHVDELTDIVAWRQGRCLPYGEGVTYWALGEIVKAQAGILESDTPDEAAAKLEVAVNGVIEEEADRGWVRARLAPLTGLAVEQADQVEKGESFAAWRRFIEGIAARDPLVLVFEDLHWADPPLLEFIDHLVDYAIGVPMLVLCTARPELFESNPDWAGGKRNSTTIALTPLSEDETGRLVSALLQDVTLPPDVQTALLERAGGNPLYAEEFVRMLTDAGLLERTNGEVKLVTDRDIPVPDTVQALIAARLDTVPPERKALLHDASVVGKVFWSGALASMGPAGEPAVRDGLHELARKELVRPARTSSVKDQAEYAFWHVLVRDVAYSQIPRAARAAKHRAAAAWIETIAGDRVADHAELLAHHYVQALELARASGETEEAEALEEPAARFLQLAGDRAYLLDVPSADAYYRRALELFAKGRPGRGEFLAKASQTAYLRGELEEARRLVEEAVEVALAEDDQLSAGRALLHLAEVVSDLGRTEAGRAPLARAVEILEALPPGPDLARAYSFMARDRTLSGYPAEAVPWAEKALTLGREVGPPAVVVRSLQYRGMARQELGDPGGLEDSREALAVATASGLGWETARAYNNLSDQVWFEEGPQAGLRLIEEGLRIAEQRGDAFDVAWLTGTSMLQLYEAGEWDECLRRATGLLEWKAGESGSIGLIAAAAAEAVQVQRGEVDAAAALMEHWLPRGLESREPQMLIPSLSVATAIEYARGNAAAATAHLDRAAEILGASTGTQGTLTQLDLLRESAAAGDLARSELLLSRVGEATRRERLARLSGEAYLAEAKGDRETAAAGFREAAGQWKAFGSVPEEAHALLGLGRATGDREALQQARAIFERLGAKPRVEEIDRLS